MTPCLNIPCVLWAHTTLLPSALCVCRGLTTPSFSTFLCAVDGRHPVFKTFSVRCGRTPLSCPAFCVCVCVLWTHGRLAKPSVRIVDWQRPVWANLFVLWTHNTLAQLSLRAADPRHPTFLKDILCVPWPHNTLGLSISACAVDSRHAGLTFSVRHGLTKPWLNISLRVVFMLL